MARPRVLLVEDDASVAFAVRTFLEARQFDVEHCDSIERALILQRGSTPDVMVCDYRLPDGTALDLLEKLKASGAPTPFIILTAHGSVDLAVRAMKEGAESFLTKPVELGTLQVILERSIENRRTRQKEIAARATRRSEIDPFLGVSRAITSLRENVERVLPTEAPVLLLGETGTGKSVLARWIHERSPRAEEAFVNLNCAGLSRELLESELFGYEKGAFTGALSAKQGLLEIGHRGTVFLDEIGDVDAQVQPKLLKVLEEKEFRRLGDVKDRRVDIRLIAATHYEIGALVRSNRLRSDLYFRINTVSFVLPPLRQRTEDIVPLADSMLERIAAATGRRLTLSASAQSALARYSWPGNIRELRNVLERAVILADGDEVTSQALQFEQQPTGSPAPNLSMTLAEVEQWYITAVLDDVEGNVERAAARLAVPRSTLYNKLRQYRTGSSKI